MCRHSLPNNIADWCSECLTDVQDGVDPGVDATTMELLEYYLYDETYLRQQNFFYHMDSLTPRLIPARYYTSLLESDRDAIFDRWMNGEECHPDTDLSWMLKAVHDDPAWDPSLPPSAQMDPSLEPGSQRNYFDDLHRFKSLSSEFCLVLRTLFGRDALVSVIITTAVSSPVTLRL